MAGLGCELLRLSSIWVSGADASPYHAALPQHSESDHDSASLVEDHGVQEFSDLSEDGERGQF